MRARDDGDLADQREKQRWRGIERVKIYRVAKLFL